MKKKMLALLLAFAAAVMLCSGVALAASGAPTLADYKTVVSGGAKSANISNHNYYYVGGSYRNRWNWANPSYSYLQNNADGTISRVEWIDGDSVTVETYSSALVKKSSRTVSKELPVFGGFFSGSKYNFLVFGQENPNESDDVEVVRVVKYDKSWKRLGSASFSAVNTYIPFDAGTVSMDEDDDTLYVHTCHEMYESGDGCHHQANMTFFITKETMADTYRSYRVWNISSGYVSHSFNQVIRTDGEYVYSADHGDAYPRSIVLVKRRKTGGAVQNGNVLAIQGSTGDNVTKATLGGMELSQDNILTVGVSVRQDAQYDSNGQKNVFLAVTPKGNVSSDATTFRWLTNYKETDSFVEFGNPWLVKVSDSRFVLLWEETDEDDVKTLHCLALNGSGQSQGAVQVLKENYGTEGLSDCAPIVRGSEIIWYTTGQNERYSFQSTYTAPSFYRLPVSLNFTVAAAITQQPANASGAVGNNVTFTVKASGSGLKYQWYMKKSGESSFTAWNKKTTASVFTPVYASWHNAQFYCVVTDGSGKTVKSNTVKLTVTPKITQQPANASGAVGDNVSFSVKATGNGLTYQWYYKKSGESSFTKWNKRTSASATTPVYASWHNAQFYCAVTDSSGKTVKSNTVKLTVKPKLTQQPANTSGAVGSKVTFSVKASGSGLKYQWYYKKADQTTWTKWSSSTGASATLTVYKSWQGAQFYCVVTDANGQTAKSNTVKLTVK